MEANRKVVEFKSKAARMRELLERYGAKLSNAQALEVMAKVEGARNWSALSAELQASKPAAVSSDSEALLQRALQCIARVEQLFGSAIDNDEHIDGGDAVEDITCWLMQEARPLLAEANYTTAGEESLSEQSESWGWYRVRVMCEGACVQEAVVLSRGSTNAQKWVFDNVTDERISCGIFSVEPVESPSALEMARALELRGISAEDLDTSVIEAAVIAGMDDVNCEEDEDARDERIGQAESLASGINNEGLPSQLAFLLESWSDDGFPTYLASTLNLKGN